VDSGTQRLKVLPARTKWSRRAFGRQIQRKNMSETCRKMSSDAMLFGALFGGNLLSEPRKALVLR